MKKTFFTLLALLLYFSSIKAQVDSIKYGVLFEKYINHVVNNSQKSIDPNIDPNGPPSAQTASGNFQFFFEDIFHNHGYGFDGTYGPTQVLCVVAAFEYIETVIDIPTLSAPIKIYISSSNIDSQGNPNFPGGASDGLAWSRPYYDQTWAASTSLPVSFSGGYLYDHIITGTPTDPAYDFDGEIAFNLQNFDFSSSCGGAIPSCYYDLFSVALHEATHLLGFVSAVGNFPPVNPSDPIISRINTNRFSRFDQQFLYSYDSNNLTYTKLVNANGINPIFAIISDICNNSFWITNTAVAGNVAKTNQPVCSRNTYAGGTTLSHLDNSYRCRSYVSPQFVPDYIMCPAGRPEKHYLYTLQEVRILQAMGYNINTTQFEVNNDPNFVTSAALANIPPRTITDNWVIFPNPNPISDNNSDLTYLIPNVTPNGYNTTLQNNTGASLTINLANPAIYGFVDDNQNPISVYPSSLVNIQGCGNGGNNQNQLVLTNGNQITFTPRPNFVGKAQFGFNLYDGKEMGAFVIITVNVTYGNAVSNGTELVLNGTFEEGSETHTITHPNLPTNYVDYLGINRISDCISYSSTSTYVPYVVIRDSRRDCYLATPAWVSMFYSFPFMSYGPGGIGGTGEGYGTGLPNDNRFGHLGYVTSSTPVNFYLSTAIAPGCTYRLSFDIAQDEDDSPTTNNFNLYYGFGNNIMATAVPNQSMVSFTNTPNTPYHTFRHFTTDITIPCNTTYNSNVISLNVNSNQIWQSFLDNVSLQLIATPSYTPLSGTLTTSPTAHTVYVVNGYLQINGNVSLTASELRMGPSSSITVLPGATLSISGSHLYNSCSDMWNGITVQPGGSINVLSTTYNNVLYTPMIEDAIVAVNIEEGSTLTTNILNVENATFNRNQYDIKITGYTPLLTPYPFSISNSVFTCRDIPFTANSLTWPLTSAIKAANNPISSPLETPYINNTTYSKTNANAYLKNPLSGQKSNAAIDLNGIGNVINPTTTPTYYEIKIGINGSTLYNVFDNHSFCINAYETDLTCVNNIFQNTITTGHGGGIGGIGINAVAKNICRLQVTEGTMGGLYFNKFFNCSRAVSSTNYFYNNFTSSDVRSTQTTAGFPYSPPPNHVGAIGFTVTTNRYSLVNISSNKIYNIENPITFNAVYGSFSINGNPYNNAQYSGQVNVVSNTIRPHLNGYTVTNQYVSNAIRVSNITPAGTNVMVPNTRINVSSNLINSAYRGIYCTNWQSKDLLTYSNTISLVSNVFNPLGNAIQYGISHTNNIPATTTGLLISSNIVTGFNTTYLYCKAIYTSLCYNATVNCNTTTNTYSGLVFDGPQAVQTRYNTMSNHHYGFVLDNYGVIGNQGSLIEPCDNVYLQPYATYWPAGSYFTATLNNSSSQNSKMYVRQTGYNANPDGFGTSTTTPTNWNNYAYSNGSLIWATGDFIGCGGGHSPSGGIQTSLSSLQTSAIQTLENLVLSPVSLINTVENKFIAENQIYRLLKANPALMANSATLQNFYTQSQTSSKEEFKSIEDELSAGNFAVSQNKVASLQPQNTIETNYKAFYQLYLKYRTDSFNLTDSTNLMGIANACPFTNGAVVYQARALLNAIYSSSIVFSDNCQMSENKRLMQGANKDESKKEDFDALVYPNPTTGDVFIAPTGIVNGSINISVTDITGKVVSNSLLPIQDGVCNFNLKVEKGTYFIKITNSSTNEKVVKSLIIQ